MHAKSRRALPCVAAMAVGLAGTVPVAGAALVSGAGVIAPPAAVQDDAVTNTHQQGFDERRGVVLPAPLEIDGGWIPAGTQVDSHMIFLNVDSSTLDHFNETWTFDGPILGVMSDREGQLEVASSSLLGAPGTSYPNAGFPARGMELAPTSPDRGTGGFTGEGYTIFNDSLVVGMSVSQPGDWIRVVTRSTPRECTGVTATPGDLWPPNHKLINTTLSGPGAAALEITGVTQDEPVQSGKAPDAVLAGPNAGSVALRAERDGGGDGRVYRISFTGEDEDGVACTGTATVRVPHDQAHSAVDSAPPSHDSFG